MTRTRLLHYSGAALLVVLATLLRMWLQPVLGFRLPLATYAIVSLVIAWYSGLGPALFATVLGSILSAYFFVLPHRSTLGAPDLLELILRSAVALTGVFLIAALRRARDKADRNASQIEAATERMRTALEGIQ